MTTLRFVAAVCAAVAVIAPIAASAETKAEFIKGTWATRNGCEQQKAIDAGGDRNVGTVPELLSDQGFNSWEGGCAFTSVTEKKPGKLYEAQLACSDGLDEWQETDTFALEGATIKVMVDDKTTEFVRCDTKAKESKE